MSWGAIAAPIAGALISGGAGLIGGKMASDAAAEAQDRNTALQREFAQQGIRWRVEDAKAAGIHPLAALGANVSSPSSVAVGDTSMGNAVANFGQDISRAIQATRTNGERVEAFEKLKLENMGLQNDLLRSQVVKSNQVGPPLPSNSDMPLLTGQGNSYPTGGLVVENPLSRVHSQPGRPGQEVGAVADYGFVRTGSGGLAVVPSSDAKQRIEDQFIPEMMWAMRNQVLPAVSGLPAPDPKYYPLPKGADRWRWNTYTQEFQPNYPASSFGTWVRRNFVDHK